MGGAIVGATIDAFSDAVPLGADVLAVYHAHICATSAIGIVEVADGDPTGLAALGKDVQSPPIQSLHIPIGEGGQRAGGGNFRTVQNLSLHPVTYTGDS